MIDFSRALPHENYPIYVSSRILDKSIKRENGCLEYRGGKLKHKYGLTSITLLGHRSVVPVHRALWMAVHKNFNLPSNVYIRHKCDNPCCVNIDHLVAGTPKDNTQDCISRGRRAKNYRPHSRVRVHDNEKILAIRNATGKTKLIADKFGVSVGYVSKIKNGKAKSLVA